MQCKYLGRIQPFQRRILPWNQSPNRFNRQLHRWAISITPYPIGLLCRRASRPHQTYTSGALGKQGWRCKGPQVSSKGCVLLWNDEKEQVLPLPERIWSCEPKSCGGTLHRVCSSADFRPLCSTIQRCPELEVFLCGGSGQGNSKLEENTNGHISKAVYKNAEERDSSKEALWG